MVALAHGTNDAQKTMGVISLALIANGNINGGDAFDVPTWVVVACATAIALGTYCGGWRMITWLRIFPTWLRDPFYKLVARTRYALFGKYRGKPLAQSEWKDRFLADPR